MKLSSKGIGWLIAGALICAAAFPGDGIADIGTEPVGIAHILLVDFIEVKGLMVIESLQFLILPRQIHLQLLGKGLRIGGIEHGIARAGAVIVNNPPMLNLNTRPDRLILKVVPGGNGSATLYEDEGDTQGYQQGVFTNTRLVHEGNTLTIEPRQGQFPGMLQHRAYTVEFLATDRPQAVSVNGQKLTNGAWGYNEQSRIVTVYIPATSCEQRIKVELL